MAVFGTDQRSPTSRTKCKGGRHEPGEKHRRHAGFARFAARRGVARVLAISAAPGRALAGCSGQNQSISTVTQGPVLSDGGDIFITTTGSVGSGTSQAGVLATVCPVTTLTNTGIIYGGAGQDSSGGAVGGAGVSNSATITTLTNTGTISGGFAAAWAPGIVNVAGGAGVSNPGTMKNF